MYLSNDVQYYILEGEGLEAIEKADQQKQKHDKARREYFQSVFPWFDSEKHRVMVRDGFGSTSVEGVESVEGAGIPAGWGIKRHAGEEYIAPKGSSKAARAAREALEGFQWNGEAIVCKALGIKYDILSGVGCEQIGPHWIVSLGKDREWNHEGKARLAKLSEVAALVEEYGEEEG